MKIKFHLNFKEPAQKYIYVTTVVQPTLEELTALDGQLTFTFPVWTPGSYKVREYASQLSLFKAFAKGKPLEFRKTRKNQWAVDVKGTQEIEITYRLFAHQLNVRGLYIDHEMAFILPSAALLHPEGFVSEAVDLKFSYPNHWSLALSQKEKKGFYHFSNFDELYDTPILASQNLLWHSFKVGQTTFKLASQGYASVDWALVIKELKQIIAQQIDIFGEHPAKEYLFQVIFGPKLFGGLEHSFSSTNMFDGAKLKDPKALREFLSLLAHEHFHLWNVKRIRPKVLGPFNYSQENLTTDLWISEGFTRYYDQHTLVRSKTLLVKDYLEALSKSLTQDLKEKAYRVDPPALASFDAWIRYYNRDENHQNTSASYYESGARIALYLDLWILNQTNGRHSLDSVMKDLFTLYKLRPHEGFLIREFWAIVENYVGVSCQKFNLNHIQNGKPLPWGPLLKRFGLHYRLESDASQSHYFGATFKIKDQRVYLQSVAEDSPAYASALQPDDEILALNGRRLDSLDALNHLLDVGKVNVFFSRFGKIHTTEVLQSKAVPKSVRLEIFSKLTKIQKRRLNLFLRTTYE